MDKEKLYICNLIVDEIMPEDGQWHFFGEENDEQYIETNIPFHSTNSDWMKGYIKFVANQEMLAKYGVSQDQFNEYLASKHFDRKLKQYQEKIVDFQLRYTTRHNSSLYSIKDKTTYVEKLLSSVAATLTRTLGMDRDVVVRILQDRKTQVAKMFDNSSKIHRDHIGEVHKCGVYCENVYESLR
ncbi:MAG: hypothetical protein IJA69_02555 [Clostridia bacterium]|nr:hypothetical protein [Clostridia bacterium]